MLSVHAGQVNLNVASTGIGTAYVSHGATLVSGVDDALTAGVSLYVFRDGTFDLNGLNQTVSQLANFGGPGTGTVTNTLLAESEFTPNLSMLTVTGSSQYGGKLSGNLALTVNSERRTPSR